GWLTRSAPAHPRPERRWQFALAASVLVAVALGVSMLLPRDDGSAGGSKMASGSQRVASSLTVRLSNVRGRDSGSAPDISYALSSSPSELVIEPDVVVLTCEDGAIELECAGGHTPQQP